MIDYMQADDVSEDAALEGFATLRFLQPPLTTASAPQEKDVMRAVRWLSGQILTHDENGDRIRDRWQLLGMAYTELLATYGADRAMQHEAVVVAAVDRMWVAIQNVRAAQQTQEIVGGLAA